MCCVVNVVDLLEMDFRALEPVHIIPHILDCMPVPWLLDQ